MERYVIQQYSKMKNLRGKYIHCIFFQFALFANKKILNIGGKCYSQEHWIESWFQLLICRTQG